MSARVEVPRVPPALIGMILFIASEIMFFGGLFAAYFSLRSSQAVWPPEGSPLPSVGPAAAATVCLIASSVTQHLAGSAGARGDLVRARRWLTATLALGSVFLAAQAWEWSQLSSEGLGIDSNAFGTTFFTLTGAHGLHVIGGLGMLATVRLRLGRDRHGPLEAATYYWHFVDVVWLVVFSALYLAL